MEFSDHPKRVDAAAWYLVCLSSGAAAVVSVEDLPALVESGTLISAVMVSGEIGCNFEKTRAGRGICPRPVE